MTQNFETANIPPVQVTVLTTFELDPATAQSPEWRQRVLDNQQALGSTANLGSGIEVTSQTEAIDSEIERTLNQDIGSLLMASADTSTPAWQRSAIRTANNLKHQGIKTARDIVATGLATLHDVPDCSDKSVECVARAVEYIGVSDLVGDYPDMTKVVRYCDLNKIPSIVIGSVYTQRNPISTFGVGQILALSPEYLAEKLGEWDNVAKTIIPNPAAAGIVLEKAKNYAQNYAHYSGIQEGTVTSLAGRTPRA
jgi:hypothetical protein